MSRFFDGQFTTASITFGVGAAPSSQGNFTVMALVNFASAASGALCYIVTGKNSGGSDVWALQAFNLQGFCANDFTSGGPTLTAGNWYWLGFSHSSGGTPRWHLKNVTAGTAFAHTNASATVGDGTGPVTSIIVGNSAAAGSDDMRGEIGVTSVWGSALSDAAVEAACTLLATDLKNASPAWAALFNQASTGTAVSDITAGGGNQTAISSTSVTSATAPTSYNYTLSSLTPWTKTASETYRVLNAWTKTSSETYRVTNAWTKTAAETYRVTNAWTKTAAETYRVTNAWVKTATDAYSVLNSWVKSASDTYSVLSAWTTSAAETYRILNAWTASATDTYRVLNVWVKSATETYSILTAWTTSAVESYRVFNAWTASASESYAVLAAWTKSTTETYRVLNAWSKAPTESYRVFGAWTKTAVESYNVLSATSFALSVSDTYRVYNAFTATAGETYRILNAITLSRSEVYRVYNAFTLVRSETYDVLAGTPFLKSVVESYRVFRALTASRTERYNVGDVLPVDFVPDVRVRLAPFAATAYLGDATTARLLAHSATAYLDVDDATN